MAEQKQIRVSVNRVEFEYLEEASEILDKTKPELIMEPFRQSFIELVRKLEEFKKIKGIQYQHRNLDPVKKLLLKIIEDESISDADMASLSDEDAEAIKAIQLLRNKNNAAKEISESDN